MKLRRQTTWTLLGSTLWLRPAGPDDLPRVNAFLARRDLVSNARGGGVNLGNLIRLAAGKRPPRRYSERRGLALVATDPRGAPEGLFLLTPSAPRQAVLGFVVPREGVAVLREALRLLYDAACCRSALELLTLGAFTGAPTLEALLVSGGWRRDAAGAWSLAVGERDRSEQAGLGHED